MRDRRGVKFTCDLMDLSVSGFRADAFGSLSVGDTIWVSLPGLSGLEAQVAWRDNFMIGCRFHTPLHPATLDHLLKTLG